MGQIAPYSSQKTRTLIAHSSWPFGLQNCEPMHLCFLNHAVCGIWLWKNQEVNIRHNLFYCALQILYFLQIESWGNPESNTAIESMFSNSIFSLHMPVSRFCNPHDIPIFSSLLYLLWWSVKGDLWCYSYNCLGQPMLHPFKWWTLISKCYVYFDHSIDQLFSHLSPSPQTSVFPETQLYWN